MLGYQTTSDHQLYNVRPLETPFGLLIRFIYNLHPHVTTITIIYYAVSYLRSLQSYTFPILNLFVIQSS
jgi:hypothetical protein